MSALLKREVAKYERIWTFQEYRKVSHGLTLWNRQRGLFPAEFSSCLDIGCGLGLLYTHLGSLGYDAYGVDLARNCLASSGDARSADRSRFVVMNLWEMSFMRRFDLGVCTDVMEHIPEEKIQQTLQSIAACCREVLFKISYWPSNDLGGPKLHLTRRREAWWVEQMRSICGRVVSHRAPEGQVLCTWATA